MGNTNLLLGRYPGVIGMKTGFTGEAGRVLVSVIEAEGRTFVGVVMGSEDHFADTAALLDYVERRLSVHSQLLQPLAEPEGGGSAVTGLDLEAQRFAKTRPDLGSGLDHVSAWGETPGSQQIEEMVRAMMPKTLGGTG